MADEMDEYRERIERHYGDRRTKNDRRHNTPEPKPKSTDWAMILDGLMFLAMLVALYFLR